jgi:hypothetical protein
MKNALRLTALAVLVAGVANAQIKKDWTIREVRDPRQLQAGLVEAFTGVEAAVVAIDPNAGQIRNFEVKGGTDQDASVAITVNNAAAVGNKHRLLVDATGATMLYQTDADVAGTYATKLTFGKDGKVTLKGGAILDNVTSADELNITETGVKVTGTFTVTGAAALNGGLTMDTDKFAVADTSGNTLIKGTLGAGGGDGTGLTVDANKDVAVGRHATVAGNATITGNATAGGNLAVTGTSTLTGNVVGAGTVKSTGDFTVGDSKLVVTATSGNVVGKGSLQVDGVIQSGKDTVAGDVRIYPATTARGYLKILAADGGGDHVTTITRAETSAARTYTIPEAGGNASFVMTAGNQTITGNTTLTGNAAASGTLTVGGAAQFDSTVTSGKTGSNGGIVVKSTGAGATTFSVAGATGNTLVAGTLEVTGVATLTAAPKFVAVTAPTDVTATMTNAPALADAAAPVWVTVTIGSDNYVIPAFKLGE